MFRHQISLRHVGGLLCCVVLLTGLGILPVWAELDTPNPAETYCLEFEQAAAHGDTQAMNELGICFLLGIGRDVDMMEAERWFKRSQREGYRPAKLSLASLYLLKLRDERKYAASVASLEELVETGNAQAAFVLALAHRNNLGVQTNKAHELSLLLKASKSGHSVSRLVLYGDCLESVLPECEPAQTEEFAASVLVAIQREGYGDLREFARRLEDDATLRDFVYTQEELDRILARLQQK